jgi:hypothetical protein
MTMDDVRAFENKIKTDLDEVCDRERGEGRERGRERKGALPGYVRAFENKIKTEGADRRRVKERIERAGGRRSEGAERNT